MAIRHHARHMLTTSMPRAIFTLPENCLDQNQQPRQQAAGTVTSPFQQGAYVAVLQHLKGPLGGGHFIIAHPGRHPATIEAILH